MSIKILCLVIALKVLSACSFNPSGAADTVDAPSMDAVIIDTVPIDAPIDALVATGLHCELPIDVNGTCEGVPRQVRCTAVAATNCTLTVPGAIPASIGPIMANPDGSVLIDQEVSLPMGLTTMTFTCKGGPGTSDASFDLPMRAARLTVPTTPVSVGQTMTVSFSAPDVVENNVVKPCSMSIGSIKNLYAIGTGANTFSWNVPGALVIQMECRDTADQSMYSCTKQVTVQ